MSAGASLLSPIVDQAGRSDADGLTPDVAPTRIMRADRELPPEARCTGRMLDTTRLRPGDLILTRPSKPNDDPIGRRISKAQENGGFVQRHARWTHAAVYLGDGEHICEASVSLFPPRAKIHMCSIHKFCDGKRVIRARSPKGFTAEQRIRLALGAMTNLEKRYDFSLIAQFYLIAFTGRVFSNMPKKARMRTSTLVCSTLYQDAYSFAVDGGAVTTGSFCTPAHLSASDLFEENEPPLEWMGIA
jgi:hypothetical protein